jgi:thiol-disulfide isomerase/thioredoxin
VSLFDLHRHAGPPSLSVEGRLPGFDGANGWLNSEPLTVEGLSGKVVLVDFWTYTCINWLRTLGYTRAWAEKYAEHGVVTIGVHTPEFPFEHDIEKVRRQAKEQAVEYPVAVDSDYGVWRAFGNRYWPALYIADAEGRIRHHQFGEGGYAECERAIQRLLRETGLDGVGDDLVAVDLEGFEAQADWMNLRSPESYLGYEQARNFASLDGPELDRPHTYVAPVGLGLNSWALSGDWTIARGASVLNEAGGRIAFRFHARDVHLVNGPGAGATPVPFRVLVDGEPPGAAHGLDVDRQGRGTVSHPRLHQLIRQPRSISDRTIEIAIDAPGVEAYAFTFG